MNRAVMEFAQSELEDLGFLPDASDADVLELGSRNVNGSVRDLLPTARSYVGMDIEAGPGVDVVGDANEIPLGDETFDLVICTEMLEHDEFPEKSFAEIARVLRPDGVLILTTRSLGFPTHDYPSDYWRFDQSDMGWLCNEVGLEVLEVCDDPSEPGVFLSATKS